MERILGPDVYTYLNDLSAPPASPIDIGAAFIGPFVKGPAIIPQVITSALLYYKRYGYTNVNFYTPYAVDLYLKYNQSLVCARTLWLLGYSSSVITIYNSGSSVGIADKSVIAVLGCTSKNVGTTANDFTVTSITTGSGFGTNSVLTMSISAVIDGVTASFAKTLSYANISDLLTIIPTDAKQTDVPIYLYYYDKDAAAAVTGSTVKFSASVFNTPATAIDHITTASYTTFNHAITPWIIDLNGVNLFKFHALSDGDYCNTEIKIAISDIKTPSADYTTFNVIVRAYGDTDQRPQILLTFYNCTLDPDSDNYIEKLIGNKYYEYDLTTGKIIPYGDFDNKSSYIRIQTTTAVANKKTILTVRPNGFKPVPFPSDFATQQANLTWYITGSTNPFKTTTSSTYEYYGWDFSDNVSKYFLKAQTSRTGTGSVAMSNFTLAAGQTKMIIPMYGGFDGTNHSNLYVNSVDYVGGFNMTTGTSSGSMTYKKIIDILSDSDAYDVNILSMPGIDISGTGKKAVFDYAVDMILSDLRQDVFLPGEAAYLTLIDVNAVAAKTVNYDTTYASVYYPWCKYYDRFLRKYVFIPISTLIPAVCAYTDLVQQPWYAPAGLNRGILNVILPKIKLNKTDRGILYDGRVNPIATFPGLGPVVWGQKTLKKTASALDRINVRRLLITLKKYVIKVGKGLMFDPNTTTLRNAFLATVNPYFDAVVSGNGLYAYKIVMDDTNNTALTIDKNELRGLISIKPTKAALYIIIPFNILRTSDTL